MNITIARPRVAKSVTAIVTDGANKTKYTDFPITLVTHRNGENMDFILLVHFFTVEEEFVGTIVLPGDRLQSLSTEQGTQGTQKIWMTIGNRNYDVCPPRAEASKYFDRLIDEEEVDQKSIKLPIFFSVDDCNTVKEGAVLDNVKGRGTPTRRGTPSHSRQDVSREWIQLLVV